MWRNVVVYVLMPSAHCDLISLFSYEDSDTICLGHTCKRQSACSLPDLLWAILSFSFFIYLFVHVLCFQFYIYLFVHVLCFLWHHRSWFVDRMISSICIIFDSEFCILDENKGMHQNSEREIPLSVVTSSLVILRYSDQHQCNQANLVFDCVLSPTYASQLSMDHGPFVCLKKLLKGMAWRNMA